MSLLFCLWNPVSSECCSPWRVEYNQLSAIVRQKKLAFFLKFMYVFLCIVFFFFFTYLLFSDPARDTLKLASKQRKIIFWLLAEPSWSFAHLRVGVWKADFSSFALPSGHLQFDQSTLSLRSCMRAHRRAHLATAAERWKLVEEMKPPGSSWPMCKMEVSFSCENKPTGQLLEISFAAPSLHKLPEMQLRENPQDWEIRKVRKPDMVKREKKKKKYRLFLGVMHTLSE